MHNARMTVQLQRKIKVLQTYARGSESRLCTRQKLISSDIQRNDEWYNTGDIMV